MLRPISLLLPLLLLTSVACPKRLDLSKVETKAKPADAAAERDFKAAEESFTKDPVQSVATFEVFVASHPQDPMVPAAYLYIARGRLLEQNFTKAKEAAAQASSLANARDKKLLKEAQYTTALAEVGLGNGAAQLDTLASFKDAFTDPAENARAALALAEAASAAGQFRRSLAAFSEAYERSEAKADQFYALMQAQAIAPKLSSEDAQGLYKESDKDSLAAAVLASRVAADLVAQGSATKAADVLSETKAIRVALFGSDGVDGLSIKGADTRTIGAVLPLTGKTSRIGRLYLRGLFFAAQGAAKPGAPPPFRLVVRDSESTPEGAKIAVEELTKFEGVVGLIGPSDPEEARAAALAAQNNGTPMVSLSLTPAVTEQGDMIFWASIDNDLEARSLARYATSTKLTKVAVLAPETSYGQSMADAFVAEAKLLGASVVARESYAEGTTSWKKQIDNLKKAKPQAIFIPDGPKVLGALAPALAAGGLWSAPPGKKPPKGVGVQLLAPSPAIAPKLLSDAAETVEGMVFATEFFTDDPKTKSFSVDFTRREGEAPTIFDAVAYEAFSYLAAGLQGGATSRSALRDSLLTGSFPSLSGPVSFGDDRRADRTLTLVRVVKGRFEIKK